MGFIPESYVCDGCGAPKRDVNHWWTILFQNYSMDQKMDRAASPLSTVEPFLTSRSNTPSGPRSIFGVVVLPFTAEYSKLQNARSVCGQQCAHRFLDLYMSEVLEGRDPQASTDYLASFSF